MWTVPILKCIEISFSLLLYSILLFLAFIYVSLTGRFKIECHSWLATTGVCGFESMVSKNKLLKDGVQIYTF